MYIERKEGKEVKKNLFFYFKDVYIFYEEFGWCFIFFIYIN